MDYKAKANQSEIAQAAILQCLRAMESVQQSVLFQAIGEAQDELKNACAEPLERAAAALRDSTFPESQRDAEIALKQAFSYLRNAIELFSSRSGGADFGALFINSRAQQCTALELLYRWRADLEVIEPYFRLSADDRTSEQLGVNAPGLGITHVPANKKHNDYSLYVPETYDHEQKLPLIVCLHGGYGSGNDYIWSWLRAARSRGYVLLSPKSYAQTWSIIQPPVDVNSIMAMIDDLVASHNIDRSRIYLSGLSDGGTFSYLLGLQHADRFCAVAPIAGVLSPATDMMLRAGLAKDLPLHVVHGVHDMIFPVQSTRSTNKLFESLGYNLTYTELPDWGHALTYTINEEIVLPWFEQLS
jgi:predicted esterase